MSKQYDLVIFYLQILTIMSIQCFFFSRNIFSGVVLRGGLSVWCLTSPPSSTQPPPRVKGLNQPGGVLLSKEWRGLGEIKGHLKQVMSDMLY